MNITSKMTVTIMLTEEEAETLLIEISSIPQFNMSSMLARLHSSLIGILQRE
jgi:hypothetical protein